MKCQVGTKIRVCYSQQFSGNIDYSYLLNISLDNNPVWMLV